MQFPHQLFKSAGLNSTDIAHLVDVSRITGYRWLQGVDRKGAEGVGVNVFLRDRVAKLITHLEAAVQAGALPDAEVAKLTPKKRAAKLRAILNQYRSKK
jgi:hypothetical protein